MSYTKLTKEYLAEKLYEACQDPTFTTKQVIHELVATSSDMSMYNLSMFDSLLLIPEKSDKLYELVKAYKLSGVDLEKTCEDILTLLYENEEWLSPYDYDFPITLPEHFTKQKKSKSIGLINYPRKRG